MARHLATAAGAVLLACLALAASSPALAHGGAHVHPSMLSMINVAAVTHKPDPAVRISCSTSRVTNGEFVTVEWSGVSDPSEGDWIGVYSPSTVDMSLHVPIKFQFANHSANYMSTGSGSLRFQLLNLRADYVFAFARNSLFTPTIAAVSNVVTFADYNKPFQVHLALTNDLAFMKVMWVTLNASAPSVTWGQAGSEVSKTTSAVSATYTSDDLCGAPANSTGWRDPGLIHTAIIGPLEPDTRYHYVVGDPAYTWSEAFNFTSPPMTQRGRGIRFVAFGDTGRGEVDDSIDGKYWKWGNYQPSLWTTDALIKDVNTFDAVLNIGDTSYADGVGSEWDEFFHQIAPVAQHKPWMTCIGNHELDWPVEYSFFKSYDSQGECGIPQEARFGMPRPGGSQKPWYSFELGNVHVTLLSTEHDFEKGSEQHTWILADLASVNMSRTPFIVFGGHRPFYVDSTWNAPPDGDGYVAGLLRTAYEDSLVALTKQGFIVLGIYGHHHTYQRTCAVYNSVCQQHPTNNVYRKPGYPIHNVIGMSGAPFTMNFKPTKPTYMEVVDDENHGFFRINTNETAMHLQFIALTAAGTEHVQDEYWITNE